MNPNLKSRIDNCYKLAEKGFTNLARAGLKVFSEEFNSKLGKGIFDNPEPIMQSIEKTSHRVGVDIAFQYAEHFYIEGNRGAARGWLRYARMHAKPINMDISGRISEMKGKYRDRMPLFF